MKGSFFLTFRYFLLYVSLLLNLIFMIIITFYKIFIYLIKTFPFLLKNKYVYFHQNLFYIYIYIHLWIIFFKIFVTKKIFKILFTKMKPIRYYNFINIYLAYQNKAFILMKSVLLDFSVIKLCTFLYNLYTWFYNLYKWF